MRLGYVLIDEISVDVNVMLEIWGSNLESKGHRSSWSKGKIHMECNLFVNWILLLFLRFSPLLSG